MFYWIISSSNKLYFSGVHPVQWSFLLCHLVDMKILTCFSQACNIKCAFISQQVLISQLVLITFSVSRSATSYKSASDLHYNACIKRHKYNYVAELGGRNSITWAINAVYCGFVCNWTVEQPWLWYQQSSDMHQIAPVCMPAKWEVFTRLC